MFHVPERQRISPDEHPVLGTTVLDGNNGAFRVDSPEPGWTLFLICSDGMQWEHVSVSAHRGNDHSRIPTWREMAFVKGLCWDDEDVAD